MDQAATDGVVRLVSAPRCWSLVMAGARLIVRRRGGATYTARAMTRRAAQPSLPDRGRRPVRRDRGRLLRARAARSWPPSGSTPWSRWRSSRAEDGILCGAEEAHGLPARDPGQRQRRSSRSPSSSRCTTATDSAEGGRDAHHGPLLGLRPVRDRDPRHPVAVHRLGDRRAAHRRRGRTRSRSSASARGTCIPSVADQMDYASVVGGCIGVSTPAGARMAGLAPTGTMPHALILIFGDTVRAAEAFDRHIDPDVPRIVAGRHLQGRGGGIAAGRRRAGGAAVGRPPRHARPSGAA